MNKIDLEKKVNALADKYWGIPFGLPVDIVKGNGFHGRFSARCSQQGLVPNRMEISKSLLNDYPEVIVDKIILHELCHWYLFITGQPNDHEDIEFYQEMKRVGGLFSHEVPMIGFFHTAVCSKCGDIIGRDSSEKRFRSKVKKYQSPCCVAKLKSVGKKYYNSLENLDQICI